jgi:hypothetical protein
VAEIVQLATELSVSFTTTEGILTMVQQPLSRNRNLSFCIVLILALPLACAAAAEPRVAMEKRHQGLLQTHCVKCHNTEKAEGKFRVDDLPFEIATVESAERWQKVLNAMNSNAMPPEDEKQPESKAKADFLEDLANVIVAARRTLFDQKGVKTMRRLNRREYRNTLRELLGVEIDVNELPSDTGTGGFDTMATNLFMSSDQFEQYLALGREALDEAFERQAHASMVKKQRFEAEDVVDRVKSNLLNRLEMRKKYVMWSKAVDKAAERAENQQIATEIRAGLKNQPAWNFYHSWKKLSGAASPSEFGFVDAETATHEGMSAINLLPYQAYFLAQPELKTGAFLTIRDNGVNPICGFAVGGDWPSGEYIVRLRIAATKQAAPERRFVEFGVHATHLSTHEVQGTLDAPQTIELLFNLTKSRTGSFFIRERGTFDSNDQAHRVFAEGEKRNGIGPEFALWVDWTEVERVPNQKTSVSPGITALRISLNDEAESITTHDVRGAVERFAAVACRGYLHPPTFFDRLLANYDRRRKEGIQHSVALKETLAVVLSSPRFIYLSEPSAAEDSRELNANELAVRLAYFLWGAPPDAMLSDLAARGELLRPEVLAEQTNRLIDDPRSSGFLTPFIHQWLGMDRLDFFRFNNAQFPAFDESTKMAARNEVYETLGYLVRQNASLRNLLSSDFVVVNSLLANYYGIDGVHGDEYRKVSVPSGSPRGGLLGMAAILAMGSNGERTSPVERGAWVLRKLLNDPPPPAPANVPQISRLDDQLLTTRDRLKVHQEQPQCASCHRKIDPIGFGLENFNAVGQWRTEDSYETAGLGKKTWTIDPAAAFHNGPEFKDYFQLREIVATKADAFARGFSVALLEYALGRPYSYSDEPLLAEMLDQSRKQGFASREFIHGLVKSKPFRHR